MILSISVILIVMSSLSFVFLFIWILSFPSLAKVLSGFVNLFIKLALSFIDLFYYLANLYFIDFFFFVIFVIHFLLLTLGLICSFSSFLSPNICSILENNLYALEKKIFFFSSFRFGLFGLMCSFIQYFHIVFLYWWLSAVESGVLKFIIIINYHWLCCAA